MTRMDAALALGPVVPSVAFYQISQFVHEEATIFFVCFNLMFNVPVAVTVTTPSYVFTKVHIHQRQDVVISSLGICVFS